VLVKISMPTAARRCDRLEVDPDRVRLPAAGGAFLASIRYVGAGEAPLVIARTLLEAADISAWRELAEQTIRD